MLIDRICTPAESTTQDKVNRGLTYYNDHLAETLPREYARVLSPVHELIKDIINRGIADGSFRAGLDVDATAALIMQIGAGRDATAGPRRRTERRTRRRRPHLRLLRQRPRPARQPRLTCAVPDLEETLLRGGVFAGPDVVMSLPPAAKRDFQEAEMPARELPYPVFDADNHFYEPKEALTKFLPDHRKGVIDYIEVRGRTKIMVRNQISDYIPNPTFEVVARPGAQEEYFRHGSGGKSYREVIGKPMKAIPAFRDPAARLEVMDELGLDYTLMFPTLASLVEERMKDDPDLIHDIIHALNEWMYETWQFNYEDRIFSTPVITLPIVDRALEELEWCLERGAKTVLVRPAPVPGYPRHPLVRPARSSTRSGRPASRPASRCRCTPRTAATPSTSTTGSPATSSCRSRRPSFRMVAMGKRPIEDTMAALVCHGALTRNPDLRILSIENGADWVPYLFKQFKSVYKKMPQGFPEDPIEAFKRVRLRRAVLGGRLRPDGRAVRRRPGDLRFRLAAPGGPGRADST